MISSSHKEIKKEIADKNEVIKNEIQGVDDKVNSLVSSVRAIEMRCDESFTQII